MPHELEPSLVALLDANNVTRGMGFLIEPDRICTCAHVVCYALGIPPGSEQPSTEVVISLRFVFLPHRPQLSASIQNWRPALTEKPDSDVAILRLSEPAPQGAQPVRRFVDSPQGRELVAYGYPDTRGRWATAQTFLSNAQGQVQIEDPKPTGVRIRPGYSGTPAWDTQGRGVAGMVVAYDQEAVTKVAFMLPSATIRGVSGLAASAELLVTEPQSASADTTAASSQEPRPPSERYDRAYYVSRAAEERELQEYLKSPVVIQVHGQPYTGKTWFLSHVLEKYQSDHGCVRINLINSPAKDLDALSKNIAQRILHALRQNADLHAQAKRAFERIWNSREKNQSVDDKLADFLLATLLSSEQKDWRGAYAILVLDSLDAIPARIGQELKQAFRYIFSEYHDLPLRVILSGSRLLSHSSSVHSESPLVARIVELRDFDRLQVTELCTVYQLQFGSDELERLWIWSEGNLTLLNLALRGVKAHAISLEAWLIEHSERAMEGHLNAIIKVPLAKDSKLQRILCGIIEDPLVDLNEHIIQLENAGLVKSTKEGFFIRYKAYKDFIKTLCTKYRK